MTKETILQKSFKFLMTYILLVPILLFVSPFSKIYNAICNRNRLATTTATVENGEKSHQIKVGRIQEQVKQWNNSGKSSFMCTGRQGWKTLNVHDLDKRKMTRIDLDELNEIVKIDLENKILTVEPGIMMGQISSTLLQLGWTIPVIPEFEMLTLGGCICGTGIESSSNQYGLSSDICTSYEVITANGEIIYCSKNENSDLFYSIPWSHGTLGFLTAVQIPLVPASKFVKVEYFPCYSISEAQKLLESKSNDFVEGIMFDLKQIVVMHGNMTNNDVPASQVNHINKWYKPWFYKHVQSYLNKASKSNLDDDDDGDKKNIEYIPLRDYYHRHTRSYFWEVPIVLPYGNNFIFRALFGWTYPINFQILKRFGSRYLFELYYVLNHVLQDFIVPMNKLETSLKFIHQAVQIYPIWLCPCKFFNKPGMVHSKDEEGTSSYIDIGIYGTTSKPTEFEPEITIGQIEQFAIENHGVQFQYAESFLSRQDFRKMFDMILYDSVRVKYNCLDAFPDIYDKISKQVVQIKNNKV